jgi:hypothetical protein
MLDDAVNQRRSEGKVNGVKVIDIAQVLADSIGLKKVPATVGAPAAADKTEAEAEAEAPAEPAPAQPLEESTGTGPATDDTEKAVESETSTSLEPPDNTDET